MKNLKKYTACIFLSLSIISVLLTVIIPGSKIALGQMIIKSYNGVYSVIALVICLFLYFTCAKKMEEDIWVNRLKLLLSISFIFSLISNIIFLK